ncbi:hypothetical protein EDD80_10335 [Anseongella ginsenosidimutans]|uniref:Alpha-2-macroglobulin family protein n=1 Tax=Anseongella ginsenosidimutans TaxID=496056 RepID=A0A4R3KSS0_9SPHI|nr:MG2 domain-containing protein [Anseongella ginsenosidimutans]QEC53300.1 hypothetical protein FRZ59_13770 [Anseongella ginsenosidimutans]TCS88174.1 hypothetical protein EDD80_10335 [Anseongella ginsenosidimutans]
MVETIHAASRPRSVFYLFFLVTIILASCKPPVREVDPAFAKYIESYTTGTISRQSPVRIRLASEVPSLYEEGAELPASLFRFEPGIEGKAYRTDPGTIEFRPAGNLEPGRMYTAVFDLSAVIDVPEELEEFTFQFQVIEPSFDIAEEGLRVSSSTSPEYLEYNGYITTADIEDPLQVEKLLSVDYEGKKPLIKWQHRAEEKKYHFTIDSLLREDAEKKLLLSWNGTAIGNGQEGEKTVIVPAKGVFKVLNMRAVNDPGQYVLLQFSQPLSSAQSLEGLVTVAGLSDLRYTVEGSELKIYAPDVYEGEYQVQINQGVRSSLDQRLENAFSGSIFFENRMPSVSILGKGAILPQSGKLVLPFDAVNLKAVDVSIIKIYEDNIPQFLQQNNLESNYDLRRVARPVAQKTIWLNKDKSLDLAKRNRFSLDIDELVNAEPGAIYTVTIGFRRAYSLYACQGEAAAEQEEQSGYSENIDEDDQFWSRYDQYYPYGFDWKERDNPCNDAYYNKRRWATKNVIASNLGLIVKRGAGNSILVSVTDILTAKPMEGVELELLDYQQQVLERGKSDGEGLARFETGRKPFLLIARKGEQRGYLKLDDGSSLPLSRFDVGGGEVQQGLKGYIYGERGVWRPGDSLFLTFMLEDKAGRLPAAHPVIFEVFNPRGQLYLRTVRNESDNGFYAFPFATGQDAPTGNWTAKVKVGGAEFSKSLKIETIMPNRLKIDLDFGENKSLSKAGMQVVHLSSRWLFGGTAQNLKASVDAYLSHQGTAFGQYNGYSFDDPAAAFSPELVKIFEGKLDAKGHVSFTPKITVGNTAPGVLKANFLVKVFEPGGNFSMDRVSLPYHAYNSYVGVKIPEGESFSGFLVTGKNHPVDIVNLDTEGKLLSGSRKVKVSLYKVQWRWWWDENGDDLSNFAQDSYNKLLQEEEITLQNGRAKWNLRVEYPEWGRYLLRVKDLESGHITGETLYIDWPGWNERMRDEHPTEAAMLSFTANKERFQVGEEVVLTIPSSEGGRCLVSIESGSKVIRTFWTDTQKGQTVFKFKAEKEMAPNVYVNVSLLQPHSQTLNDLPIRMYGVIPILVEAPETILKPAIDMPASIRPEEQASVTVSEASGKAMTYTLAIVDEGLLDLTRFNTPDPHAAFYAREALGVKTWDLFDAVIGAWGGDLERILSIGGDEELNRDAGAARANRFKPVVKFMGPFRLEKGKEQTHSFRLDPYIGSVRVMVVAGDKGAYGMAEKAVSVKKPLMLLATLPRVLSPGEKVRMPVTVFSTAAGTRDIALRLSANKLIHPAGGESSSQTVHFNEPGEQLVYFELEAGSAAGIGKVSITASSGNQKANYEVELDIRNPNPVVTNIIEQEVAPGKTWETNFLPVGTAGSREGYLEVSAIPALQLAKHLDYLVRYPHGCLEQVTSSVFPQLVLEQLSDPGEQEKAAIARNVKAGIQRLKGFQRTDGGLAYWPGAKESDEWGTSYAGHFLLEARERGYSLPPGFLDQWVKYQRNKAAAWSPGAYNFQGGDLLQAYRLYLLAAAGAPEMGAMNRLREFSYLHPVAGWLLAAAYHLGGQAEAASRLADNLPLTAPSYRRPGRTYGSSLRDKAIILQSLVTMGRREQAKELLGEVSRELSGESWYSTQTTAWSLISIAEYCGKSASGSKLLAAYGLNNDKGTINTSSYLARIPLNLQNGKQQAMIRNDGENVLFVRWVLSGQPAPGENPPPAKASGLLGMTVKYKSLDGKPVNPARMAQGTDFMAEVTLNNPGGNGDYQEMALSQVFPSGWEIINTRLSGDDNLSLSSSFTYQDIRDDRVYTYFDLPEKRSVTYHVMLNAAYPGRFYQPPVYCEAMYDAGISARTAGRWVEIYNPLESN